MSHRVCQTLFHVEAEPAIAPGVDMDLSTNVAVPVHRAKAFVSKVICTTRKRVTQRGWMCNRTGNGSTPGL